MLYYPNKRMLCQPEGVYVKDGEFITDSTVFTVQLLLVRCRQIPDN